MSSLSVVIKDVGNSGAPIDVSRRTLNVSINEKIDATSSASVSMKGLLITHALDDISVRYGSGVLFDGLIEEQSDSLRSGIKLSVWRCKDASMRLTKRVVNKRYTSKKVEDIIADLLASYPCGISGNHVAATNVTIEEITFPYRSLLECIKQLAEITGYRWYIDADRDLHFFNVDEGVGSTVFSTTIEGGLSQNIAAESIKLKTFTDERTANRVWVIGAKEPANTYVEQAYTGDGMNDLYPVALEPNYPEVFEDGVSKTVEVDRGNVSTKDWVYDKQNRVFRRVGGNLPASTALLLRYRPTRQVIDYFEDSASIATFGIYEKAITDKTIKEKLAARSRGRAELRRRSSAKRTLSFDTIIGQDTDVRRGLRYRIVIPEIDIDSMWLCTGVSTTITAPDHVNIRKTVEFEEVA